MLKRHERDFARFCVYLIIVGIYAFTMVSTLFTGLHLIYTPSPPMDLHIPNVTMTQFVAVVMFIWPFKFFVYGIIATWSWEEMKKARINFYVHKPHTHRKMET